MHDSLERVQSYLHTLQETLLIALEGIDGAASFCQDQWSHDGGGGGQTCVISQGAVFEQGGVNFSLVHGDQLPASALVSRPELEGVPFTAMGVSVVMHPWNPFVPTAHANVRFFSAVTPSGTPVWWFGGGYDLTPYYGFEQDCRHWHEVAQKACQPFGQSVYPRYKKWCDEYFFLKHRGEPRGIGGLFFDNLNEGGFERCFEFMRAVGDSFLPAYLPIVIQRKDHPYTDQHRAFQLYRRGRYVEFNLVYDRGTLFGLQSGGRVESILMSLPPQVSWSYNWQAHPESEEAKLQRVFLTGRDWLMPTAFNQNKNHSGQ